MFRIKLIYEGIPIIFKNQIRLLRNKVFKSKYTSKRQLTAAIYFLLFSIRAVLLRTIKYYLPLPLVFYLLKPTPYIMERFVNVPVHSSRDKRIFRIINNQLSFLIHCLHALSNVLRSSENDYLFLKRDSC